MSIHEELKDIVSNLDDNSLLNNSLRIRKLLYIGAVLDSNLSDILFISAVELLEKIKRNPKNYNATEEQISALSNIINKMVLVSMDSE